ncbi:MAG: PAS domain S-box protein [Methanohalobium sp.]|uniref:PAS domain S-box protein n=1 Tax=Methanohalobium sp. TaxID=2837493 RepID=UPI0039780D81
MIDEGKNRIQLINELNELRQKISGLEKLIQAQMDLSYNKNNLILLESVFDIIPDVICIYDGNYGVIRYNKSGYEFLKTNTDESRGKKCFEVIGKTSPCAICAVSNVYKTHKPSRVYRKLNSSGLWLDIRAYPILNKDKKLTNVINYIHDVTFEKQTDELLELNKTLKIKINEHQTSEKLIQKEKERMQKYFDVAGIIIVVIGSDYKVKFINKKGIEILGFKNKDIIGKDWIDNFIPIKYRKEVKGILTKFSSQDSGPVENVEYPLINDKGEERTITWNYTPVKNDDEEIYYILASGLDITERKNAEKALQISENKFRTLFDNASDAIFI